MEPQYVKTGEDKKYEYYRNDSEVLSSDEDEEKYEQILNQKNEFAIKINNKEIIIKKRTINRIMILSDSQPEEQIVFSHYKTVDQKPDIDRIRKLSIKNDNMKKKPPETSNVQPLNMYTKLDEPIKENIPINIPPIKDYDQTENLMFKKTENVDNLLLIALPPKAQKLKWFYLLLVLCGIVNIIYFLYCLFDIKFLFNAFLIMIFGFGNIFTGFLGFNKINKKIYNDKILNILTYSCAVIPILNVILILASGKTKGYIAFGLIVNIIAIIFAILCILFTQQLKKEQNNTKSTQLEKLL